MAHAQVTPALADALLACDVTDPHSCGMWLHRMCGVEVAGLQVVREGGTRDGVRWAVQLR